MSNTMTGVVYHGPGDIRVESVPVPACGEDELRVKVDACAVCGTDLKMNLHGNPRITPPQVIGHEFTGFVETVGVQVEGFALEDRVVMATSVSCGECYYCRRDWRNLCPNMTPVSLACPGAMAAYITIPARALRNGHVIKVPVGVEPNHAALAEPLSCAVNGIEQCGIQEGDTVVVVGGGPLGIMMACLAQVYGAGKVILSGRNAPRLRRAEAFGFDRLVNPREEDLAQIVMDETEGLGADVAIVAAPQAEPQEQALSLVRKRGTVSLFASLPKGNSMLSLDSRLIHYGEIKIVGASDSAPRHVTRAVDLIARGVVLADKLVTHVLGLDGIFDAFELMQSGEGLRVVLKP